MAVVERSARLGQAALLLLLHLLACNAFGSCPTRGQVRNGHTHYSIMPALGTISTRTRSSLRLKEGDDLDSLLLDESTLSGEERERLNFIRRAGAEADDLVRQGGFSMDGGQDDEEIERAIRETNWSGQSDAEETRISRNNIGDLTSRPGLVFCDCLALVVFAAIGRSSHAEGEGLLQDLATASPFLVSWLGVSPFLGAYSRTATKDVKSIPWGIAPAWAAALPLALIVRGISKGVVPPTPFILVSLTATFVLLLLGRALYVLSFGNTSDDEYRTAGFFEVFKMVGTLVKRW